MQMTRIPRSYFLYRSLSVILDQIWLVAMPLYLADHFSISSLGLISSSAALGDLFGMILFPWLSIRIKSTYLVSLADMFQLLAMIIVGLAYFTTTLTVPHLVTAAFCAAAGFSVWFAASDTIFTEIVSPADVQRLHRNVAVSQNLGPVIGPAIGGYLYSIVGLGTIAFLNAFSFSGQVYSLYTLSKFQAPVQKSKRSFVQALRIGWRSVFSSRVLGNSLFFPVIAKIFVFSFLPFLAFYLRRSGLEERTVGLVMAPYGIGILLASFRYQESSIKNLARLFRRNALSMCLLGFVLITWAVSRLPIVIIPLLCLTLGGMVARYQIQFRSLRQLNSTAETAAGIISIQGLAARAATPFAGFLFAFLLQTAHPLNYLIPGSLLLLWFGFYFSHKVVVAYETI
jgi:MFS family permease